MAKQKEKQTKVPRPRKLKPTTPHRAAPVASNGAPPSPSLDYIAEALRPLAVRCDAVQFDPHNARKHPDRNLEAIKGSLTVYGQRKPIVVNKRTGHIEAGNATLQGTLALNREWIAAVYVDDAPGTATGYALADNRSAELAEWDAEELKLAFADMELGGDDRLEAMMEELRKETGLLDGEHPPDDPGPQIDRAAELQKKWKTETGQLWLIDSKATPGKAHRLLCGDSTKAEDVALVMGGEKAAAVITDPPYGIGLENHDAGKRRRLAAYDIPGDANDEAGESVLQTMLATGLAVAAFAHPMKPWSGDWRQFLAWDKGPAVGGGGDMKRLWKQSWELIQIAGNGPLNGQRDEGVLHYHCSPQLSSEHVAAKPSALIGYLVEKLSDAGGIIFDPFLGSGTAIVAAEQTARLCCGVEISAPYIAVCLERLAGLGLEPRLAV